eukprot:930758-Pelagomonas_calceolata.AAC.1
MDTARNGIRIWVEGYVQGGHEEWDPTGLFGGPCGLSRQLVTRGSFLWGKAGPELQAPRHMHRIQVGQPLKRAQGEEGHSLIPAQWTDLSSGKPLLCFADAPNML